MLAIVARVAPVLLFASSEDQPGSDKANALPDAHADGAQPFLLMRSAV